MALGLTKRIGAYLILLFVLFSVFLSGCDPYAETYPFLDASAWVCRDPYITLIYTEDSKGRISAEEHLTWHDMQLDIDLHFQANTYCVSPESSTDHDKRLFTGTWEYRNGDLILKIEEDFVFDYVYSELIFMKTDME